MQVGQLHQIALEAKGTVTTGAPELLRPTTSNTAKETSVPIDVVKAGRAVVYYINEEEVRIARTTSPWTTLHIVNFKKPLGLAHAGCALFVATAGPGPWHPARRRRRRRPRCRS